MNKKLILIFLIILVVIAAALAYIFGTPKEDVDEPTNTNQTNTNSLKKISEQVVISPINSYDNDALWYGSNDGGIFWYNILQGSETKYPTPQPQGSNFLSIYWPSTGSDFIIKGDNAGQNIYSYYNYAEKKYYPLPANIQYLDWLPDAKKIVIVWKAADGKASLVISNADATGYKIVTSLPWADLVPKASPTNANEALMIRSKIEGTINKIYLFDLNTGEYQTVVDQGLNSGIMWAPNGKGFAYTQTIGSENHLYYYDMTTKNSSDLGAMTIIPKTVFSPDGAYIYAAAAKTDGAGEELVKISLTNSTKEKIVDLGANFNAKDLVVIGSQIALVNLLDGKLYIVDQK
jgi:hypothetical protein